MNIDLIQLENAIERLVKNTTKKKRVSCCTFPYENELQISLTINGERSVAFVKAPEK